MGIGALVNSTRCQFRLRNLNFAYSTCECNLCWISQSQGWLVVKVVAGGFTDQHSLHHWHRPQRHHRLIRLPTASIFDDVAVANGYVNIEANPWKATETALSDLEHAVVVVVDSCVVAIIGSIDLVEDGAGRGRKGYAMRWWFVEWQVLVMGLHSYPTIVPSLGRSHLRNRCACCPSIIAACVPCGREVAEASVTVIMLS